MQIRPMLCAAVAVAAIVSGAQAVQAAGEAARCGGAARTRCDGALWCDPRPGRCASPHARGRCVVVPQACTMIYQPVCGCDGNTYANDCVRRSSGVARKHDGAC